MAMPARNFALSGQAEIIRASQKDDLITNNLQENLSDIILKVAGNRAWLQWRGVLNASAKLLYYGITTLSNYQTIGEEYTGIVQVDKTRRQIPSKWLRLMMIILDSSGQHVFLLLLQRLEQDLKRPSLTKNVQPEARAKLLQTIAIIRQIVPFVLRFHKAKFFLHGGHYHLSKRLTGVYYILVRQWLTNRRSDQGFRLLGRVSLLYLLIYSSHSLLGWWRTQPAPPPAAPDRTSVGTEQGRCSLCMEQRKNTSATSCGHLFCWDCIMQWLSANQMCPMCREVVVPSRVVLLQNYAVRSY